MKRVYVGASVPAEYTFRGTTRKLPPRMFVELPDDEADYVANLDFTYGGELVPEAVVSLGGLDPEHRALTDADGNVVHNTDPSRGTATHGELPHEKGEVLRVGERVKDPVGAWDAFLAAHPELVGLDSRGFHLVELE